MGNLLKGAKLLNWEEDKYNGVTVKNIEQSCPVSFKASLRASMDKWRKMDKHGVWIKIPRESAELVPVAVKEGFWPHHAEKGYFMMVNWIPDTDDTFPLYATHRVSVGVLVVNEKNEVLVVQEKKGHFKGKEIWKIPTGILEKDEDIDAAAMREVDEETGIQTEFLEVIGFRQKHKFFYNKSDMLCFCALKAISTDLKKGEEIKDAKWIHFDEYKDERNQESQSMRKTTELLEAWMNERAIGFKKEDVLSTSGHPCSLYFNQRKLIASEIQCPFP